MKKRKAVLRNSMAVLLSAVMASSLTPAIALAGTVGSADLVATTQTDAAKNVKINGQLYETISEFFYSDSETSEKTATIELNGPLTEAVVIPAGWVVTLNLNKHTITCPSDASYTLKIKDHVTATVRNGYLDAGSGGAVRMDDTVGPNKVHQGGMSLTLENVIITSLQENSGGIDDFGEGSSLKLTNCEVSGDWFAIYHNGSTVPFHLDATNSKITKVGDGKPKACAIYVSGSKENTDSQGKNSINMTGCTVTGPTGIEGKYTDMTLTDCDVTANVADPSFTQSGSGATSVGFAVVSTDNSTTPKGSEKKVPPKPEAAIVIDGGTYTGLVGLSQFGGIGDYEGFTEATYNIISGKFNHDPRTITGLEIGPNSIEAKNGDLWVVCDHVGKGSAVSGYYPATCGSSGYSGNTVCDYCEQVVSRGHAIPATGQHAYGEWKTTKEATEAEPGSQERSCSVCGEKETQETPALGHKPSEAWKSDANDHWKVCEGCGAELEKAPHSFGEWETTKEATELEPGEKARSCDVCGAAEAEELPALGHKPSEAWQSDANAHWKVCEGCGAELERAAHAYGEWKTTKEATTEAAGFRERSCAACGHVQSEETPKLAPAVPEGGSGWVESNDGTWGYVEAGEPVDQGWKEVGGEWYYFEDEAMQTGWAQVEGDWYYLEESGKMDTGWKEVDGDWYYLEDTGKMATGWQQVDGDWYHLGKSGRMDTGWKKVGGEWYYMSGSGAMRSGWQRLSGKWYLLNAAHDGTFGAMLEGWQRVDAKAGKPTSANSWYYLEPGSGAMAAGRWVGGYYVDASGLWIP